MFFVVSINPVNSRIKIVGHADTVEAAIKKTAEIADLYVKSENEPLMHRGQKDMKLTDRIVFFTKKCSDNEYFINVYSQQTQKVKTWTGITYEDTEHLVRRFCFSEYAMIPDAPVPPPPAVLSPTTIPTLSKEEEEEIRKKKVASLGINNSSNVGWFPESVIGSMKKNELFQKQTEFNQSPLFQQAQQATDSMVVRERPLFKHTVFQNTETDSDEDNVTSDE